MHDVLPFLFLLACSLASSVGLLLTCGELDLFEIHLKTDSKHKATRERGHCISLLGFLITIYAAFLFQMGMACYHHKSLLLNAYCQYGSFKF